MKIKLANVRLAFPDLWEATSINDGEPRFGACFIVEPGSANAKTLDAAIAEVAKEKWQGKISLDELAKKDKVCFRHFEKTNASGDVYGGFEDMYWVQASNPSRPLIIDRDKSPLTQADGRPYSGCYVNVQIDIWAQDNKYGKRVNATLSGVQFSKDGDAFSSGAPASQDDFDDLSGGSDADDMV